GSPAAVPQPVPPLRLSRIPPEGSTFFAARPSPSQALPLGPRAAFSPLPDWTPCPAAALFLAASNSPSCRSAVSSAGPIIACAPGSSEPAQHHGSGLPLSCWWRPGPPSTSQSQIPVDQALTGTSEQSTPAT